MNPPMNTDLPMWIRRPILFAKIVQRYWIAGGRMGLVCIVRGHHDKSPPKGECNVCDFVWTEIQMEYDAKLLKRGLERQARNQNK